jgi:hypothetical protein
MIARPLVLLLVALAAVSCFSNEDARVVGGGSIQGVQELGQFADRAVAYRDDHGHWPANASDVSHTTDDPELQRFCEHVVLEATDRGLVVSDEFAHPLCIVSNESSRDNVRLEPAGGK